MLTINFLLIVFQLVITSFAINTVMSNLPCMNCCVK